MIPVRVLVTRVPSNDGLQQFNSDLRAYIDPRRVDTVTHVDASMRRQDHLPDRVRAVIRYDDARQGFRLLYVEEDAEDVARGVKMLLRGEDDWRLPA